MPSCVQILHFGIGFDEKIEVMEQTNKVEKIIDKPIRIRDMLSARKIAALGMGQVALLVMTVGTAHAQLDSIDVHTSSDIYSTGQPLFVYGSVKSEDSIIVRLRAPDGSIVKFDQINLLERTRVFNYVILTWPEPTPDLPYGTYSIEVISTLGIDSNKFLDVSFAPQSELIRVPVERHIDTDVFAPDTTAINSVMRIFVQVTSDGLLLETVSPELFDGSHIHLPDGTVHDISEEFQTLHRGLFYVDYVPDQLGIHMINAMVFHHGTSSHGSDAVTVMSQDIGGISDQIIKLDAILDETSLELDRLKSEISQFGSTLEAANQTIDSSVTSMSDSVDNVVEASLQLNSLLFPIMGSIAVIVALQITILARRR